MSTSTSLQGHEWLEAGEAERCRNLSLALVASAGLHLILLITLSPAPGSWRHGLQPALQVALRQIAPPEEAPPVVEPGEAAPPAEPPVMALRTPVPPPADGLTDSRTERGASLPSMQRYFLPSELDVLPRALERGPLIYPEDAYVWRLSGAVRARVFISEQGAVDSVQVLEARPRPGIFEQAAVDALRQVRYAPAQIQGAPVKSQRVVEVVFNPHEDAAPR